MKRTQSEKTAAAGLATPGARFALLVVWVCGVSERILSGTNPFAGWWAVLVYSVALVGALLITNQHNGPLQRWRPWALAAVSAFQAIAVVVTLSAHSMPAQEMWILNFATYFSALMIPRGNHRQGTLGLIVLLGTVIGWSVLTQQDSNAVFDMVSIPLVSGLSGYAWRYLLQKMVVREDSATLHIAQLQRKQQAHTRAEAAVLQELNTIRTDAVPLLTGIAQGQVIDHITQREYEVAEGRIRDRINAPEFGNPILESAVAASRKNGGTVLLLGLGTYGDDVIPDSLARTLAKHVQGSASCTIAHKHGTDGSTIITVRATDHDERITRQNIPLSHAVSSF